MRRNTRPTMLDSLIGPLARASCELVRLSPITNTLPAGTLQPPSGLPVGRVAHEHLLAGGVGDVGQLGRHRGDGALGQVALVEQLAVDADAVGLALGDGLAGQRDDALHQVVDAGAVPLPVGLGREHDDVAAVQVVQVVAELVDQDPVPHLQRRHHRLRRDVERLEQEGLDDDRDDDRDDDQDAPLDEGALRVALRPGRRCVTGRGRGGIAAPRTGPVAPPVPVPGRWRRGARWGADDGGGFDVVGHRGCSTTPSSQIRRAESDAGDGLALTSCRTGAGAGPPPPRRAR